MFGCILHLISSFLLLKKNYSWVWYLKSLIPACRRLKYLIPACGRQRQVNPSEFKTSLAYAVPGQLGLQGETLSSKIKTKNKHRKSSLFIYLLIVCGGDRRQMFIPRLMGGGQRTVTWSLPVLGIEFRLCKL